MDAKVGRIAESRQGTYLQWIQRLNALGLDDELAPLPDGLREEVIGALVATTVKFETRASLFREKHPLALQVILSSGVLNGILVARSVESCAHLLRQLFENELALELDRGDENYRLIEKTTGSTLRVIAKHRLLANAFGSFYRTAP
jgi:hypothetical protein